MASFGALKEKIPTYTDSIGTPSGEIEVYEEGMIVKTAEGMKLLVPFDYVQSIVPVRDLQLGKTEIRMVCFELIGSKNELRFILNGVHLAHLKKLCNK